MGDPIGPDSRDTSRPIRHRMRHSPEKLDDLELDLPALDGDGMLEEDSGILDPDDGVLVQDGLSHEDPFDDSTGEDSPIEEIGVDGAEGGWLVDADAAGGLDVGPFDVAIEPEGKVLEDDEADNRAIAHFDLVSTDETTVADSGEEGPLADDEELREEDLPALDADDDGDVADEELFDRAMLGHDEELRWDDRAWSRSTASAMTSEEPDDSGILAVPGDDPAHSARDATWKRLEESGSSMAAAYVPGGSVVIALATADRSRALLVRVQPDGEARIIAEVDPRLTKGEDDGEACSVTFLRWDAARGCLFVGGNFGVETYRPG
jgi:hypothetical protein